MSDFNIENSDDLRTLTLVLRWLYAISPSDYLEVITTGALANLPLGLRHQVASQAIDLLEVSDPGVVPRNRAAMVDGRWEYGVGWGGTEAVMYMVDGRLRVEVTSFFSEDGRPTPKGGVVIRGGVASWWAKEGHSYARLKWLLQDLERDFPGLPHQGDGLDRIRAFDVQPGLSGW